MKRFYLSQRCAIINFSSLLCDSEIKIISSKPFELVLAQFLRKKRLTDDIVVAPLKGISTKMIVEAYKLLLLWSYEELEQQQPQLALLLSKREAFYRFTEAFYDDWRRLERYGVFLGDKHFTKGYKSNELINNSDQFNARILYLYRSIAQKIMHQSYLVYRQLPAGVNASLVLYPHRFTNEKSYESLQGFHFIQQALIRPPFMIYSKANKREGLFKETKEHLLKHINLNKQDYVVYPIFVGHLLAFVYIHIEYIHHGVALSNLFELAPYQAYVDRKPDLIMIYGADNHDYNLHYYKDMDFNIYMGLVSLDDHYDYFGYLKKMLLTLHNVYMIDKKCLPIHGSMVNIILNDGSQKNVIIVGDSGAGKSETLEALRLVGSTYIKDMRVIFDDMGLLTLQNDQLMASGTETGAFVRLDDLESGYAYREIDRAIFLNPDQTNARVVLPVSDYQFITNPHPIDLFLYANNYEKGKDGLQLFDHIEDAINVFKQGKRLAKGTTSEIGLVESFFANPFGPIQQEQETSKLIDLFMHHMANHHIEIGEIYTKLAIPGLEKEGPKMASEKLLQYLIKKGDDH